MKRWLALGALAVVAIVVRPPSFEDWRDHWHWGEE